MNKKTLLILSGLIMLLVIIAAAVGVASQITGAHMNFVTARGEHATLQSTGFYRYNPVAVVNEGVILDVIDLCLTVPLFMVAILLSWHGTLRGRLLLGGMLFYFFYKYLQYAVMLAFNPLFLVYVAIFALSAAVFFLNISGVEVAHLPAHVSARFPYKLLIGFTFAMSAILVLLWFGRIIPYTLAGRFPDELAGMTTLVTQAFDLGMVVPLLVATGVLLWKRSPWGYFLAAISATFGFIMSIALPAWIVAPLMRSGQLNLVEAVPLALLCFVGLFVAERFFWSIRQKAQARFHGELASVS